TETSVRCFESVLFIGYQVEKEIDMPEKNIVVTSGIPMTPPSSGGGAGGYGVSISAPSLPSGSDLAYRQGYNAAHKYQRAVRQKVESDYATSTSRLPQKITEEVAKMRSELLTSKSSTTEGLKLVKATIEKLISQASQQRDAQVAISLAYDGADPTPYPIRDKPGYDTGDPEGRFGYYAMVRQWAKAYEAAYQAKLLGDMVSLLSGQLTNVNTELTAAAVAKAAADKTAAAAAKIAAAQAEEMRANTFRAQGSVAAAQPLFVVSSGVIAVAEATATLLAAAIRSAIVGLASAVAGSAALAVGVFSLLAYSPKLGNSEMLKRYSFSTPLSDLAPNLSSQTLQAAAAVGGTVDLPVRISSKTAEDGRSEVFVVKTDGVTIPSKVKVIAATYNAGQNVYTTTTADVPPRTLTWTPIVSPGNSSTTSPVQQPAPPVYTGATVTPVQGRIDTFP
ncbi:S-type pyocin domain-containing protein, partial [Pseudomonas protegens]|uniref:S-type pyocin domain-containing protein n=1 Tax=Pseudomonas protegens TaxID=380021 RepID=UPI00381EFB58